MRFNLSYLGGGLLIAGGILTPSLTLIQWIRPTSLTDLDPELAQGAFLFKCGLVILGAFAVFLASTDGWRSELKNARLSIEPDHKWTLPVLVTILLSASALRLYGLGAGLWLDEILTYVDYVRLPFGEIISTYNSGNQHFLYSLLARASFLIFGESSWSLRLPAVLFGIGSIWAIYLFCRQVTTAREALFSAALVAFSYHHVWFSQNARGYTGLLFWTLLSSWAFLQVMRQSRARPWLAYATVAALGVYTHLTMIFVIITHFIIGTIKLFSQNREANKQLWINLFLCFFLATLLTFQFYALVLPQYFSGVLGEESTVQAWKDPLWTLLEFTNGIQIGFSGGVSACLVLIVFGAGCLSFQRTNPLVLQLLFLPSVLGTLVVVSMGHHLWPRFFFFIIGFASLVVIRGATSIGNSLAGALRISKNSAVPTTAFCALLLAASATSLPQAYHPKQDYLGALRFVESQMEQDDAVVTVGLAAFTYTNLYETNWKVIETPTELNKVRSRAEATWLVYTFPQHMWSVYPEIMSTIEREFEIIGRFWGTVGNGTIFVCRSEMSATQQANRSIAYSPSMVKSLPTLLQTAFPGPPNE